MDNPKNQLAEKLKTANYVLVTVSHDPSVDQLAALIGLTLLLNKAGKHATAVFSGQVPSTLEFLKPDDTIEKTTDSLRDFIIALDKSKADKLRYKVEDDVVRIFITPYKTSITKDDLEFSQGDFNVDVVVALGVTKQEDLDQAIITHGRILHDATVTTVNISSEGDFGSIHWQDPKASSLSEMITELAKLMDEKLMDSQIATAFLTGIVAETERFSNAKTSAAVMSVSAALMAAGANQQLVASQLAPQVQSESDTQWQSDEPELPDVPEVEPEAESKVESEVETQEIPELAISHEADQAAEEVFELPEVTTGPESVTEERSDAQPEHISGGSRLIFEPPTLGGQLTANSQPETLEGSSDPFSSAPHGQDSLLSRGQPMATMAEFTPPPAPPEPAPLPAVQPMSIPGLTPPPPAWVTPMENPLDLPIADIISDEPGPQTLTDLESAVQETPAGLDAARDEVMQALNADANQLVPQVESLTAVAPAPVDPTTLNELPGQIPSLPLPNVPDPVVVAFDPAAFGITSDPGTPVPGSAAPQVFDPTAAPPVPPPIPFNFGTPPTPPPAA
jgi:hypothetical protein